ncbi:MAG: isoamylase early set domain-containing protein [Gammaproteobacteria bacterium]|nr:isoamylase early set domain-containing protein [Gammaproteobacteria bacterium]
MTINKRYFKTKPHCTVTFRLPKRDAGAAQKASVVGEFNEWQTAATPMTRLKDGSFKATVNLAPGRQYQFRYLLDDNRWVNEAEAEAFVPTEFHDAENSVVGV